MSRNRMFWIPALLGCLVLAGPAGATPAQEKPQEKPAAPQRSTYLSNYEIRFLGPHAAETLAWDQCPKDRDNACQVRVYSEVKQEGSNALTILEVRTDGETHEKISRALARQDIGPETQTFFLVLLAAGPKPLPTPPQLSGGAQKALQDLQGFLPYKGYEVLDSTLLRGTRSMNGRLVGRNGLGYDVELYFQQPGGPDSKALYISSFSFGEDGPVPIPPPTPESSKAMVRPPRSRLIRSSFSMNKGETLVVGTSRIDNSDQALVLLLTSQP
jgi:hypothetical protein